MEYGFQTQSFFTSCFLVLTILVILKLFLAAVFIIQDFCMKNVGFRLFSTIYFGTAQGHYQISAVDVASRQRLMTNGKYFLVSS
jgi:hypothetical protein